MAKRHDFSDISDDKVNELIKKFDNRKSTGSKNGFRSVKNLLQKPAIMIKIKSLLDAHISWAEITNIINETFSTHLKSATISCAYHKIYKEIETQKPSQTPTQNPVLNNKTVSNINAQYATTISTGTK